MKILIMSVTAGEGHNSTANAMKTYITGKGIQCDILDTFMYISRELGEAINKGYLFVSSKMKSGFKTFYRLSEKRKSDSYHFSTTRFVNQIFIKELNEFITGYAPDVIIYTHPFVGVILDLLKQKRNLTVKTVGVLTDFTFHPYWEEALRTDYVIMPCEMLEYQGLEKGFKKSQLIPTGVPINPKFSSSVPKEEARLKLGLDPTKKTLLLMGGSMGYGKMSENLAKLDAIPEEIDFQIITVSGNNKAMKNRIDKMETKRTVLSLGFVNNVDLLMDASDCIVSKPGGLTTSEALAKKLPMLIVNPIPGHEARNTEFLLNHGTAMAATKTCTLPELVYQVFTSPVRLESMKNAINAVSKPNSTRDACEFAISLVGGEEEVGT